MNAILVGCGSMSPYWFRAAAELGVQLKALVDIEEKNARIRAQEFNLDVPIFTDLKQAIHEAPADALFDCTIPAAHKEVSSTALAAGLHVLEEKPLALTYQDAAELVALAKTAGKHHVVLQNRRFNRGIRQLREMLVQGVIGEVTTIQADLFVAPHFGGFREAMPHVFLADMAIHAFDAARFITGLNAQAVVCEEWNPKNSWYTSGPSVVAIFRMAADVRFSFRGSWCADGFRTSWDAVWRVIGTQGTLTWDGENDVKAERLPADHLTAQPNVFLKEMETVLPSAEPDSILTRGHISVMNQFLSAVDGGPAAETRSSDNINSLAMVLGAIESAEQGTWVEVRGGEAGGAR